MAKLIVIGGSIGTGKTTLAYKLKEYIEKNLKQNCIVLESDTERRLLLGYSLKIRMQEGDYGDAVNARLYPMIDEKTFVALKSGYTVIRTMTGAVADYQEPKILADKAKAEFTGLFLFASEETIRKRLKERENERHHLDELSVERGHASDADAGVLLKFPLLKQPPADWHVINAEQTPEKVFQDAIKVL